MSLKRNSIFILICISIVAVCAWAVKRRGNGHALVSRDLGRLHLGSIPANEPFHESFSGAAQGNAAIAPWDYHKPLSAEERQEFEAVEIQVQKFNTWGRMDKDQVPNFQQTLFKMGDRAIADLARGLSQLSREEIQDRTSAESVVQRIDELAYFANSSNPLAGDCVKALATRPVTWNADGQLQNPVEANITFEMFDVFAKLRPLEAVQFIQSIEKKNRPAFFTHYAYGRKLAGKTLDGIDSELKAVFGSPELALK